MTTTAEPWTSSAPEAVGRQLVQLPLPVMEALNNGELETARTLSTQALTPFLIGEECRFVWEMRIAQINRDPRDKVWVGRLVVDSRTGTVVGRAGFHGRPDENGMVEIGYAIDPKWRRQGHARAAVRILLDAAKADPSVRVVRASVRPDNIPSRRLVDGFGFQELGEQRDGEDLLEVSAS